MADKILKSLNFGTEDDYYFAQSADKINGVISVENGGFGATTADEARQNIGAASEIFVGNLSTKLKCLDLITIDDGKGNLTVIPNKLPAGYTRLDYIESTGDQYVILDLSFTKDTVCRVKFNMKEFTGNCIVGSGNAFRFFNAGGGCYLDWARGRGGDRIHGGSIKVGTLYDIEFGDFYVKDLSTNKNIIKGTPWGDTVRYSSDAIKLMWAGALNPNVMAKGRFYILQVIEKGKLIRNLLPCITPNDEIGMYCNLTNKFYGNAGTGAFIAGMISK